jgi:hypothetical protein
LVLLLSPGGAGDDDDDDEDEGEYEEEDDDASVFAFFGFFAVSVARMFSFLFRFLSLLGCGARLTICVELLVENNIKIIIIESNEQKMDSRAKFKHSEILIAAICAEALM